ncbi:hypothetical protein P7C73_g3044, partial [Tremellales sp. Uapishka_1]
MGRVSSRLPGLRQFAVYVFDYGAPVGFRIAVKHPERIIGIISQAGNAYDEGLSPALEPLKAYWAAPADPERRKAVKFIVEPDMVKGPYVHGVPSPELVSPDCGILDYFYLSRPGALDIQLDLLLDYGNTVKIYPKWQAYFRQHRPKLVAIWGKNDPFFTPPGAEAFKRDLPDADIEIIVGAHFLNDFVPEKVAAVVRKLL